MSVNTDFLEIRPEVPNTGPSDLMSVAEIEHESIQTVVRSASGVTAVQLVLLRPYKNIFMQE
jgi:hypothetical protein